jgi:transposase
MEVTMNVKKYHTHQQLLNLYKIQPNPRLARRLHGVYLASKGLTCSEIMKIIGAGRRTIQQWINRYNHSGLEGLRDKPRPGQPTKLPKQLQKAFCKRIDSGPTEQDGVSVLNGPAIQRILEREFGVLYSLRSVQILLHRLGYSYLSPRPRHKKADPQVQERFKKTWAKGSKA